MSAAIHPEVQAFWDAVTGNPDTAAFFDAVAPTPTPWGAFYLFDSCMICALVVRDGAISNIADVSRDFNPEDPRPVDTEDTAGSGAELASIFLMGLAG